MATPGGFQALTKRKADMALMPPPPAPKRIKRPATVLDEDVYADTLARIIKRDFFPGLLEMEAQLEFLEAMESKDAEWIQESSLRLDQIMTPGPASRRLKSENSRKTAFIATAEETPKDWAGSTPASIAGITTTVAEGDQPKVHENMRLSGFQAKYVSEDSESFYKLIDNHNKKMREKRGWVYHDNKLPSKQQLAIKARAERLLEASSDATKSMELAIRNPEDHRPAMPNIKRSAPLNSLMFNPESIEDGYDDAGAAAPRDEIVYANTRVSNSASNNATSIPPSPSLSAIDAAIEGNPRKTASEADFSGSETPQHGRYRFVSPEPSAEELAAAGKSQGPSPDEVMKLLPAADPVPNPFNIGERSKREELGRKMVEEMAAKKRMDARKVEALRTPTAMGAASATPRFLTAPTMKTPRLMTPAARNLLGKLKGSQASRGRFDKFGAVAGTPRRTPLATPKPGK